MKKVKRIMALVLAIFLFCLYGLTLIVSIVGGSDQDNMLKACIYSSIVIPILLWTYNLIYRVLKRDSPLNLEEDMTKSDSKEEDKMINP